jgi:hypothetical protein
VGNLLLLRPLTHGATGSEGSDSEGEGGGGGEAAPRPRRAPNTFRFRNFAQRLAAVDVDIHRRLGPLCATPTDGAHTHARTCAISAVAVVPTAAPPR